MQKQADLSESEASLVVYKASTKTASSKTQSQKGGGRMGTYFYLYTFPFLQMLPLQRTDRSKTIQ